jgi:hypothetical protein
LILVIFPGEDPQKFRRALEGLGGTILPYSGQGSRTKFRIRIPLDQLEALCEIEGVRWVEEAPRWKLLNNVSTDILEVRIPRDTQGLYGDGQIVGIADTGLDMGSSHPALLLDDFEDGSGRSRVLEIFDLAADGNPSDPHGHGTHVAGSLLGNGILSGSSPVEDLFPPSSFAGMAPKASLVFQAIMDNASGQLIVPPDLGILFEQAREAGARLHSDSWGTPVSSQYDSFSEDVDRYTWEHPEFLILFAAGNEGIDADGDGVVDLSSLTSPATAKNCISVGATEGDRPSGSGAPDATYGGAWPDDYPEDPLYSDHISDNPRGMAAFSSRGPCADGRIKPDLVAPGTNILSVRSSVAPDGNFWGIYDDHYAWMGGTSMSTPLAAGVAALLREYLMKEKGFSSPSAALLKAALLNAAEDISPGQYGTGDKQEIPDPPIPNPVEGWGRVNLRNAVSPQNGKGIIHIDEKTGLQTGQIREYAFRVTSADLPLKTNLVWTDYPGTPPLGGLVNDLDLELIDPSGDSHYPDPAGAFDRTNNAVGMTIESPLLGDWIARIHGYNVPFGPQPFALVISGGIQPSLLVEPDSGGPGVEVTLTGMDFGAKKPKVYFYQGDLRKKANVISHDPNRIICRFPTRRLYTAGLYGIEVRNRTTGVTHRFDNIFQLMPPEVVGADKVEVTWKESMTLTGTNFGTRRGKIWFEGVAPLDKIKRAKVRKSDWRDEQVILTVPKNLPTGDYRVRLENKVGQSYLAITVRVTAP